MTDKAPKDYTVLVIDDEEIYLSLVKDALEDEEYNVKTASVPQKALDIISSTHIDLLITDIRMPEMTGIQLLKEARKINNHIGAIFMTGYANLNTAKDAIKEGAFDYISKPFELNEMRVAVRNAIIRTEEEAGNTDTEEQLDRLSDLSQVLVKVDDRRSLATTSLEYVMMHYGAKSGTVIVWDNEKTDFTKITISNNATTKEQILASDMMDVIQKVEADALLDPAEVKNERIDKPDAPRFCKSFYPGWLLEDTHMINVPIHRAGVLFGFLMIGPFSENNKLPDFKFLSITSGQLAVSLENLALLEETRHAYASLQQLQDETIQLEKMATRGEMSAEIGHELNNFLGVVTGNLSLMKYQISNKNYSEIDKYTRAISENIDQISKFTSNLMDLTPISSSKEIIRFDQLLSEVIEYLRPQKRFEGVSIELIKNDHELLFNGDVTHIQQVLYNIFNNAADATLGCEQRNISASCKPDGQNKFFSVSIKDTGVGFTPENLEKAFNEKFTTKPNGHGFGLLVCKRIIENHDGELTIDSEPDRGSDIKITFSLAGEIKKVSQLA